MVHKANQQSTESIAHTLSILNPGAGTGGPDIAKRPMANWTADETRTALEMVGVTSYQMNCLEKRGVRNGADLKLYMLYLCDPVHFMLNGPNEDLTIPQHAELHEKFDYAYRQPAEVSPKPGLSGAAGKRTETGVAIEKILHNRFTGLDTLGAMRLETREQYADRMNSIKSDLLNYIDKWAKCAMTMADKNALEDLAVAHGLALDSPTKASNNAKAKQPPADQLPKAQPKGAEESKESNKGKKQPPAKPMGLAEALLSSAAKKVPKPVIQPASLTFAGRELYAVFNEEFERIDAMKAAGAPVEAYASDFNVALTALRDQIADYQVFGLSKADLDALKQLEAFFSVNGNEASVASAKV